MYNISILTVTQYSRRFSFRLLVEMIEKQTMKPTEWIIVEGSKTLHKCKLNKNHVKNAVKSLSEKLPNLKIKYIPNMKRNFAEMLNIGNNSCTGDFIIQMEDDDYYPPTRIEHAVNALLKNPNIDIAGCSSVFFLNLQDNELFIGPYFGDNHSCNHALAYRKSYLLYNSYKHNRIRKFSVESSFLNQFNNKMIQLNPIHTIINTCHFSNSVERKDIINGWKLKNLVKHISIEDILRIFPDFEYYKNKYENIYNMNVITKNSI